MSDPASTPANSGDVQSAEPDVLDTAQEAALVREVLRVQERHREGGIEPELRDADEDLEPGS